MAMLLNYNPHPTLRMGIAQIFCPKSGTKAVIEAQKKKEILCLQESYEPLDISPKSSKIAGRREKDPKNHQIEVLQNWGRWTGNQRVEAVAQMFQELLVKAKETLGIRDAENRDEMDTDSGEEGEEKHPGSQAPNNRNTEERLDRNESIPAPPSGDEDKENRNPNFTQAQRTARTSRERT